MSHRPMRTVEEIHAEYVQQRSDLKTVKQAIKEIGKPWNEIKLDHHFLGERIAILDEIIRIIEEHLL